METTYGLRWQGRGIRRRPPEPGEETLLVFTSQPYLRFTAARFARIVSTEPADTGLRMRLELGSRAVVGDDAAWQGFVLAGPNPSEQSQVWAYRVEDDHPAGTRPPVEYAAAGQDEAVWRRTVERLADDVDYEAAVFLRVVAVRPADVDAAAPLAPPYRLRAERPYHVAVVSYDPRKVAEASPTWRLVPFYDDLATAVVAASTDLPADGLVDLAVEPIVPGPGWLELNASRGDEVLLAATLDWVAEKPIAGPSLREPLLAAPNDAAIVEREGLALYALGRYADAERTLASLPMDSLSPEGRATLLGAEMRQGHLPEPLERVRLADLSRDSSFRLFLAASANLEPADQVALSRLVVQRLVSDERAIAWLSDVAARRLPAKAIDELLDLWAAVDPSGAAAARDQLDR